MSHRRNFVAIALTMTAIALANAASQPQPSIAVIVAKPVVMSVAQFLALKSAVQRRQAIALRANIRALARKQPDLKKRVDFAAIDHSRTPVLVLPAQLETLRVIVRGDHYTAVSRLGNAIVTVDGTHAAVTLPAGSRLPSSEKPVILSTYKTEKGETITDALEGIRIEQSMAGISMSFVRFGHLYDLSIDCPDAGQSDPEAIKPDADDLERIKRQFGSAPQVPSQCTTKNILEIAGQLEVLGGRTR